MLPKLWIFMDCCLVGLLLMFVYWASIMDPLWMFVYRASFTVVSLYDCICMFVAVRLLVGMGPLVNMLKKKNKDGAFQAVMAIKNLLALVVLLSVLGISVAQNGQNALGLNYYKQTCPDAEAIVRRITVQYVSRQQSLAAALLRLHFHDCFVRGCDGSILLKSPNNDTERNGIPNLSLRGFEVVDAAKSAVEKKCPGVVSCADVLSLVARDAISVINGPSWPVPLGRRDGRISRLSEAILPSPFGGISALKQDFFAKGLNTKDLVVLSGSHTIGISNCGLINRRIYNFTGKGDFDPSMNPSYVRKLKKRCKPNDFKTPLEMDPGNVKKFDSNYFNVVAQRKGLFISDSTLLDDPETKSYIDTQVATAGSSFLKDFSESMVKLGLVEVTTGQRGEIRKKCASVNRVSSVILFTEN